MNIPLIVLGENKEVLVPAVQAHLQRWTGHPGHWCKNEADAERHSQASPPNLVITDLMIAQDASTLVDYSAPRGLALVQKLRVAHPSCFVIFLVDNIPNEPGQIIQVLERCRTIQLGLLWETALDKALEAWFPTLPKARRSRQKKGARPPRTTVAKQRRAEITIQLNLEKKYADYHMKDESFVVTDVFDVALRMKHILLFSDAIGDPSDRWPDFLEVVRTELMDGLFSSGRFMQNYHSLLERVDNRPENIDIQFRVAPLAHPIILEAASDRVEKYWMLSSPIFRSVLSGESRCPPIFQAGESRKGLRCLVIESPAAGLVDDVFVSRNKPLKLGRLETSQETKIVCQLLSEAGLEVELLRLEESESAREQLEATLTQTRDYWDLVHYIGHSHFGPGNEITDGRLEGEKNAVAYLFLPHPLSPTKVSITDFAKWLRRARVRFVYMSSCRSSQFAFVLAQHDIGSSLGFRWDIENGLAAEMAEKFYTHVAQPAKSLQKALFDARLEMREKFREERIWAAPVLMNRTR